MSRRRGAVARRPPGSHRSISPPLPPKVVAAECRREEDDDRRPAAVSAAAASCANRTLGRVSFSSSSPPAGSTLVAGSSSTVRASSASVEVVPGALWAACRRFRAVAGVSGCAVSNTHSTLRRRGSPPRNDVATVVDNSAPVDNSTAAGTVRTPPAPFDRHDEPHATGTERCTTTPSTPGPAWAPTTAPSSDTTHPDDLCSRSSSRVARSDARSGEARW